MGALATRPISKALTIIVLTALLGVSIAANAAFAGNTVPAATKIKAVATIFPIADLVAQVGGERVQISFLLPAGASPHTYEPRPSQLQTLAEADVLFRVGAGLELWLEGFLRASGVKTVTLTDGMRLLQYPQGHNHGSREVEQHSDNPVSQLNSNEHVANPHVWLDPVRATAMVERITNELCRLAPQSTDYFEARAAEYTRRLHELDQDIRKVVSKFAHQEYVAFHSSWTYFASRYGLTEAAVIEGSPGKEPGLRQVADIIRTIRQRDVAAVFAEPQLSRKLADVIATEARVEVVMLDPLGGPDVPGRSSYLDLMRYNVNQMAQVMSR